jgi:Ca2+-binding EF-hand superfamily protein
MYKIPEDGIPYLNFKTFCEVIYIFSDHCKPEDKTQAFFKLFDFDNDGRIGIKDIKTYLKNLKSHPFQLHQRPIKEDDSDDSEDKNKKEVNLLDVNQLQNQDFDTQIAQVVIREATSGNKDYLDYFDFRYLFINTQFIPDYCHYIYLQEEIDVEPLNPNLMNPMNNANNVEVKSSHS